jgi:hypothetical protein
MNHVPIGLTILMCFHIPVSCKIQNDHLTWKIRLTADAEPLFETIFIVWDALTFGQKPLRMNHAGCQKIMAIQTSGDS